MRQGKDDGAKVKMFRRELCAKRTLDSDKEEDEAEEVKRRRSRTQN